MSECQGRARCQKRQRRARMSECQGRARCQSAKGARDVRSANDARDVGAPRAREMSECQGRARCQKRQRRARCQSAKGARDVRSAKGAQYDSQGQARSASPLVCDNCNLTRPERPKYHTYYALSGLHGAVYLLPRGDALRACPWLSYCAPLALLTSRVPLALLTSRAPLALLHIARRWRSGPTFSAKRYRWLCTKVHLSLLLRLAPEEQNVYSLGFLS